MEQNVCKLIPFRPAQVQGRDSCTYTEVQVKAILYGFARDLGCKWRKERLQKFIDAAFNY